MAKKRTSGGKKPETAVGGKVPLALVRPGMQKGDVESLQKVYGRKVTAGKVGLRSTWYTPPKLEKQHTNEMGPGTFEMHVRHRKQDNATTVEESIAQRAKTADDTLRQYLKAMQEAGRTPKNVKSIDWGAAEKGRDYTRQDIEQIQMSEGKKVKLPNGQVLNSTWYKPDYLSGNRTPYESGEFVRAQQAYLKQVTDRIAKRLPAPPGVDPVPQALPQPKGIDTAAIRTQIDSMSKPELVKLAKALHAEKGAVRADGRKNFSSMSKQALARTLRQHMPDTSRSWANPEAQKTNDAQFMRALESVAPKGAKSKLPTIGDKDLAIAAGMDAGNRSAKKAGRTQWNADDSNAASKAHAKVMGKQNLPAPKQIVDTQPVPATVDQARIKQLESRADRLGAAAKAHRAEAVDLAKYDGVVDDAILEPKLNHAERKFGQAALLEGQAKTQLAEAKGHRDVFASRSMSELRALAKESGLTNIGRTKTEMVDRLVGSVEPRKGWSDEARAASLAVRQANAIDKGMLVDKAAQAEITKRSKALGRKLGDNPTSAHQDMGTIKLPDGTTRRVWQAHASDAIVVDPAGNTVVIERGGHGPGKGMLATPGGFIDPTKGGGAENATAAARRELAEEAGVSGKALEGAKVTPLGKRKYGRSFDIREAANDIKGTPIKKGDLFTVSTQGFRIETTGELSSSAVKAGDDARKAMVVKASELNADKFGVKDHFPMIKAAMKGQPKVVTAADFDFSKGKRYRKTATLTPEQVAIAKGGEEVVTRQKGKGGEFVETRNTAKPGDRIVTRSPGDSYVMGEKRFNELYEPHEGGFRSKNTGRAIRVKEDVRIKAPWGEWQTVKKGGVIFKSDIGGSVYGNQKDTFNADFAPVPKGRKAALTAAAEPALPKGFDPYGVKLVPTAQREGVSGLASVLKKMSPAEAMATAKAQTGGMPKVAPGASDAEIRAAVAERVFNRMADRAAAAGGDKNAALFKAMATEAGNHLRGTQNKANLEAIIANKKANAKPKSIAATLKGMKAVQLDAASKPGGTVKEMRAAAKAAGLKGYSKASKATLADMLASHAKSGQTATPAPKAAKGVKGAKGGRSTLRALGPIALGAGIAAGAIIAANRSAEAGESIGKQVAAGGLEAGKGLVIAGGITAGAGLAARGLMQAGLTAAKAVPLVGAGLMAGGAAYGAYRAHKEGRSVLMGAAKGAWDWSLPGGIVNTGLAVKDAVQSTRTRMAAPANASADRMKAFTEADARFKQGQDKPAPAAGGERKPGWSPESRIAAAKARGAVNLPYGGDASKAPDFSRPKFN